MKRTPPHASAGAEEGRIPPDLSAGIIEAALDGYVETIGRRVLVFTTVDSTNVVAHDLAVRGFPEGAVIIADAQTCGRGRHGRTWFSPPRRNLHISILLRPPLAAREAFALTLMSATACCRALRDCTGLPVSIKWPNDLVCERRKLGGILIEAKQEAGRIRHAVIGIGLNVNIEEADLVDDLKDTATSIRIETGTSWERTGIIIHTIQALDRCYRDLREKGPPYIRAEWLKLTSTIGRTVRLCRDDETLSGVAVDIDEAGSLVLQTPDGTLRRVLAGDLAYVRSGERTG
jgi:BirA family biotin operon repressor/biotin-[acetyl-CoA-carboxylase] ligase